MNDSHNGISNNEPTYDINMSAFSDVFYAEEAQLPGGDFQTVLSARGCYIDSFISYAGQGKIYITAGPDIAGYELYINEIKADTSCLEAGRTYSVDISRVTVNGTNTIRIANVMSLGDDDDLTIHIPYPVIISGSPEEVGIHRYSIEAIEEIIENDVEHGFPGGQIAIIKDGRMVYENSFGYLNSYDEEFNLLDERIPVNNNTLYDLASNTKMYSVNYVIQYLITQGKLSADTRIADIMGDEFYENTELIGTEEEDEDDDDDERDEELERIRDWKSQLTVGSLLKHEGGFPASPKYYADTFNQVTRKFEDDPCNELFAGCGNDDETREATWDMICKTPLEYEPGTDTIYSDVDYMVLCFVAEKITGKRMDELVDEYFCEPMGLSHITYNPLEHGFNERDCAATEPSGNTRGGAVSYNGIRCGTIWGEVHDELAYYSMAGVSGHAGLFANASDLSKMCYLMLTGGYDNKRFFSREVIDMFTAPKSIDCPWYGLGWWRKSGSHRANYFSVYASDGVFGHQGWTGTLTLIDPYNNLVMVYLTNTINTPIPDVNSNPDYFSGRGYTSGGLGFVPGLIYIGLGRDDDEAVAEDIEIYRSGI